MVLIASWHVHINSEHICCIYSKGNIPIFKKAILDSYLGFVEFITDLLITLAVVRKASDGFCTFENVRGIDQHIQINFQI